MLAKFSGLISKGPYLSLEKEKETFCVLLTFSIKWAREIRKFHVAVVQQKMRVMTSQYEISGKNHICSVKTFSFRCNLPAREKNSLEQAAFWHELKVVCCLPTSFYT